MSEFVSAVAQSGASIGLLMLLVVVATAVVRVVALDGYGHRPSPRGTEDWDAHGLPSRPYGC
ncbi:MAG: hypothetical protein LH630_08670 [Actinomycetia bacterium]|nr:hypothetical protein [Actinomycetes bacterium]